MNAKALCVPYTAGESAPIALDALGRRSPTCYDDARLSTVYSRLRIVKSMLTPSRPTAPSIGSARADDRGHPPVATSGAMADAAASSVATASLWSGSVSRKVVPDPA
jgi:hypothetical protein